MTAPEGADCPRCKDCGIKLSASMEDDKELGLCHKCVNGGTVRFNLHFDSSFTEQEVDEFVSGLIKKLESHGIKVTENMLTRTKVPKKKPEPGCADTNGC